MSVTAPFSAALQGSLVVLTLMVATGALGAEICSVCLCCCGHGVQSTGVEKSHFSLRGVQHQYKSIHLYFKEQSDFKCVVKQAVGGSRGKT